MYREWRHFDFHARLTKQNLFSETTEAGQSCNEKKLPFAVLPANAILAQQIYTLGIKQVPPFFP